MNSYASDPLSNCGGSLLGGDSRRIGDHMCGEAEKILAMREEDNGVERVRVGSLQHWPFNQPAKITITTADRCVGVVLRPTLYSREG